MVHPTYDSSMNESNCEKGDNGKHGRPEDQKVKNEGINGSAEIAKQAAHNIRIEQSAPTPLNDECLLKDVECEKFATSDVGEIHKGLNGNLSGSTKQEITSIPNASEISQSSNGNRSDSTDKEIFGFSSVDESQCLNKNSSNGSGSFISTLRANDSIFTFPIETTLSRNSDSAYDSTIQTDENSTQMYINNDSRISDASMSKNSPNDEYTEVNCLVNDEFKTSVVSNIHESLNEKTSSIDSCLEVVTGQSEHFHSDSSQSSFSILNSLDDRNFDLETGKTQVDSNYNLSSSKSTVGYVKSTVELLEKQNFAQIQDLPKSLESSIVNQDESKIISENMNPQNDPNLDCDLTNKASFLHSEISNNAREKSLVFTKDSSNQSILHFGNETVQKDGKNNEEIAAKTSFNDTVNADRKFSRNDKIVENQKNLTFDLTRDSESRVGSSDLILSQPNGSSSFLSNKQIDLNTETENNSDSTSYHPQRIDESTKNGNSSDSISDDFSFGDKSGFSYSNDEKTGLPFNGNALHSVNDEAGQNFVEKTHFSLNDDNISDSNNQKEKSASGDPLPNQLLDSSDSANADHTAFDSKASNNLTTPGMFRRLKSEIIDVVSNFMANKRSESSGDLKYHENMSRNTSHVQADSTTHDGHGNKKSENIKHIATENSSNTSHKRVSHGISNDVYSDCEDSALLKNDRPETPFSGQPVPESGLVLEKTDDSPPLEFNQRISNKSADQSTAMSPSGQPLNVLECKPLSDDGDFSKKDEFFKQNEKISANELSNQKSDKISCKSPESQKSEIVSSNTPNNKSDVPLIDASNGTTNPNPSSSIFILNKNSDATNVYSLQINENSNTLPSRDFQNGKSHATSSESLVDQQAKNALKNTQNGLPLGNSQSNNSNIESNDIISVASQNSSNSGSALPFEISLNDKDISLSSENSNNSDQNTTNEDSQTFNEISEDFLLNKQVSLQITEDFVEIDSTQKGDSQNDNNNFIDSLSSAVPVAEQTYCPVTGLPLISLDSVDISAPPIVDFDSKNIVFLSAAKQSLSIHLAKIHYHLAKSCFEKRDYASAISACNESVRLHPIPQSYLLSALCHYKLGDLKSAWAVREGCDATCLELSTIDSKVRKSRILAIISERLRMHNPSVDFSKITPQTELSKKNTESNAKANQSEIAGSENLDLAKSTASGFSQNLNNDLTSNQSDCADLPNRVCFCGIRTPHSHGPTVDPFMKNGRFIIDDTFLQTILRSLLRGVTLDIDLIFHALLALFESQIFKDNVTHVDLENEEVNVFGDTHGQFSDTLKAIASLKGNSFDASKANLVIKTICIFNGDFVDRGRMSVENFTLLATLSVLHPQKIYLNRGNHEFTLVNSTFGLLAELKSKYQQNAENLSISFNQSFSALPIATIIKNTIFITHGGLPSIPPTIEQIQNINRHRTHCNDDILTGLMWSDPNEHPHNQPSRRGTGVLFGTNTTERFLKLNNLELIVRSHEYTPIGYKCNHKNKVITIFSAPNYCSLGGVAAYLSFGRNKRFAVTKDISYDINMMH